MMFKEIAAIALLCAVGLAAEWQGSPGQGHRIGGLRIRGNRHPIQANLTPPEGGNDGLWSSSVVPIY